MVDLFNPTNKSTVTSIRVPHRCSFEAQAGEDWQDFHRNDAVHCGAEVCHGFRSVIVISNPPGILWVPHKHQTNMSFCFAPEVASGSVSGAEIRVKRPTVGILENNRTLGKQNIAAIIEILNEAGVFVKQFGAEASDYRSPSRRNRNYFITIAVGAVKIDQTAHDFIEPAFVQRFVKVLAQQKLGPGLAASIMLPVQEDAAGMYTPEDLVDSLSLKRQLVDDKPDDEPAWRSHHLDIFRRALMVWPPSYEGEELAAFRAATKHLSERMRQNCFYFSFHPIAENTVRPDTYHDVHMTLKWNNVSETILPCVTCGAVVWSVRMCRLISGEEAFAAQGFPARLLPPAGDFSNRQLFDLAGNSFNGFVFGAILTAAMASLPWATEPDVQSVDFSETDQEVAGQ